MKRFILNFILVILISILPVLSINYFADASGLFYKSRFYDGLEEKMKYSKLIEVTSNHDERIFKKKLLETNAGRNFNSVVFGSSRVMLVSLKQSINLGVSGASLEDILGLYQILKDQSITMDSVLIGVDPWLFYKSDSRWKSISSFYYKYLKISKKETIYDKSLQLINLTYFQESYKQLFSNGIRSPYVFHDIEITNHTGIMIFPDGHIRYGDAKRTVSEEEINKKIDSYLAPGNHYKMNSRAILDENRVQLFEEFLSHLTSSGTKVCIMFPSYHPRVYKEFSETYKVINQTEELVRKMENIELFYGSYNPTTYLMNHKYFYDGMHLKESGVNLLLNKPTYISINEH